MRFRTICSLLLTGILLLPAPGWAQQASGPKTNLVQPPAGTLKIVVLQGEGAVNSIKSHSATQPAVEVRDEQDKPVVGAEVVFQLPAAGPGGVFNGWMRTQTARTNAQGQAAAQGLAPNDEPGRFNIKVTATEGKRTASLVIAQSNAVGGSGGGAQAKSGRKTLWIVLGLVAVGGIIGGVAATRGGGSTAAATATNPITIGAGPVTVAGPK